MLEGAGVVAAGLVLLTATTALIAGDDLDDALDAGVKAGREFLNGARDFVGNLFASSAQRRSVNRAESQIDVALDHIGRVGNLGPDDRDPDGKKRDWLNHAGRALDNADKWAKKVKGRTGEGLRERIRSIRGLVDEMGGNR